MAVGNTTQSPITYQRDNFQLQAKIKEAKVLGPAGAKTDLIQKLALTAQPGRKQKTSGAKKLTEATAEKTKGLEQKTTAKTGAMGATAKTGGMGAEAKTGGMGISAETTQSKISTVYNGSDGFNTQA